MIALPIKYIDYDGVEREEKFYFHLSYADLVRLELDDKGGFKAKMETLIKSENQKEIWNTIEEIVKMASGKKSPDGRRFDKSYEAKADFIESEAYSSLIRSLLQDANYASEFINGLVSTADKPQAAQNILAPQIGVVK